MDSTIEKVAMQITEREDEFIYETISPFCDKVMETHIPKKLLLLALLEYRENHPVIYEEMTRPK